MTLQRITARVRASESLGEHRVGRLVLRGVLTLVAVLLGVQERAFDTGRSAERALGGRIDRRTRHRARLETLSAGLVQIAHGY